MLISPGLTLNYWDHVAVLHFCEQELGAIKCLANTLFALAVVTFDAEHFLAI
jgi:hypothetical protein